MKFLGFCWPKTTLRDAKTSAQFSHRMTRSSANGIEFPVSRAELGYCTGYSR
jgi:hypothetical protein